MSWLDDTLDALAAQPVCGYAPGAAPATEPTAVAALALAAADRAGDAEPAIDFLNACQTDDGSIGIRQGEDSPGWPTAWAVLAWQATNAGNRHDQRIRRAAGWQLAARGETMPQSSEFGHNTELAGWSWAAGTHSWVEPTALFVLALKATGFRENQRVKDGVALLIDRQLPRGGLNYGNTYVLGQLLKPHVQPTGVSLLALAGERDSTARTAKTIAWLAGSIGPDTTASSLAFAVLGLAAHGKRPADADEWLAASAHHVQSHDRSPYKLALLALAAKGWPL